MPLPKLSPLQSRLAASLVASIALLVLYFVFSSPHFAYAAEVDSIRPEDHNHDRLGGGPYPDIRVEELALRAGAYEGEFLGYDESIMGRAPTSETPDVLLNNQVVKKNLEQGGINSYSFLKDSVLAGSGLVFISVNTCIQPNPIQNTTVEPPPQLRLYISQSENNTNPGPTKESSTQEMHVLEGGVAMVQINATGDVFIGLYGESTTAYKEVWNAEIAASIDGFYHTFYNSANEKGTNLFLVDSDSTSALLVTADLTSENSSSPQYQAYMNPQTTPPYTIFASRADDIQLLGLQNSYCALNGLSQFSPGSVKYESVQTIITNRGNNQPRQQFYISGLDKAASYNIAVGKEGNDSLVGRKEVWPMTNFTTLLADNCVLVHDLSFCTQTAYAVPGNPNSFPNSTALAAFYDNSTQGQYEFFKKVLAQIPCETTSSAQYSLAKTCDDCAAAYKDWLCSVTIPRCADWSSTLPWLQRRNMVQNFPNGTSLPQDILNPAKGSLFLNSSRNPNIDEKVMPGPYKELLPCDDLCYKMVQSCPAAMNFGCPRPGHIGFNQSYGLRPDGTPEQVGQVTCNYPGAEFNLSSGGSRMSEAHIAVFVALAVMTLTFI